MRVALIQDHLRSGGTERQTLAIAEGLQRAGVETQVIVFRRGGTLDAEAQAGSFETFFLNQGPFRFDWFALGLRSQLKRFAPDVVFTMGRMANCHAGILCLRRPNTVGAIVATCRTGRSIPFLHRLALRHADHVVANSQSALSRLKTDLGPDLAKSATVVHNGCLRNFDTLTPSFPSPEPRTTHHSQNSVLRLCSVSMFRPQKRQSHLLRICSQLPGDINWRLVLAGDGPTFDACKAEARRLGIENRVEFPGLLNDPRSLYSASDIAVHASNRESLPNFLVEAQMAGLPVVAYDVDGVSETFRHAASGFLVPLDDESAFRSALVRLCRDPELRATQSEAARHHAQARFSLEAQNRAYFELVESLASSSGR